MLLRLEVLSRYSKGCLFFNHSSAKVQKDYMTSFFCFVCYVEKVTCKYTDSFYALFACSGGNYPLTVMAGIAAALRKRIRRIYWIVLFVHLVCFFFCEKEKKGGEGGGGLVTRVHH